MAVLSVIHDMTVLCVFLFRSTARALGGEATNAIGVPHRFEKVALYVLWGAVPAEARARSRLGGGCRRHPPALADTGSTCVCVCGLGFRKKKGGKEKGERKSASLAESGRAPATGVPRS